MEKLVGKATVDTMGNARTMDELARILIPKKIRGICEIGVGDEMEICVKDGKITLTKTTGDNTGGLQQVDALGRITIPEDIRKDLKINYCEKFDVSADGKTIVLERILA